MKKVYQFLRGYRGGSVSGVFVCTEEEMNNLVGKEIYLGEVLGKHSEVFVTLEEGECACIAQDPVIVAWVESNGGFGINLINALANQEEWYDEEEE